MAQGNNNFLSLPRQEGLFVAIKSERSGQDRSDSPEDDEDEEENEEDVRLIPRSSPVPRKRGHSLTDETAEYMRIRFALPRRRVSFADASGAELVDVREFVPFDSDEEDDARWEEEEAKYRKAYSKPVYQLHPEFQPLTGTDLVLSVHKNKVEVESVSPVPDEPLSFDGVIRVLNISFHKSVYVRSTMDGWITHFDYPTEYVQGSNDGDTDKFSARLSFAEPYLFNGARIDFVVRYETSDGEFWANNSGRNYSVTLLQSYDEDASQSCKIVESVEIRGILKPPRFRTEDDSDLPPDDEGDVASSKTEADVEVSSFSCPVVIAPEIDIEDTETSPVHLPAIREDSPPAELPSVDALNDEQPQDSSKNPPQTDHPETIDPATKPLLPTEYPKLSIEKLAEDHDPSSNSDRPHQVPSDLDTTLLAMFPRMQHTEEDRSGKLEELELPAGLSLREAQMQDQTFDKMEDETCLQVLQEPAQPSSFSEMTIDTASKDDWDLNHSRHREDFSRELQNPLEEKPEMQTVKEVAEIRAEMMEADSTTEEGEESADILSTSPTLPHEANSLGLPREDRVTQSLPILLNPFDLDVTIDHKPKQEPGSEAMSSKAILVEVGTLKAETPMLTIISPDSTNSTEAESPQGFEVASSATGEELVIHEEFQLLHKEPFPPQIQVGQENQLPLPNETSEASSAESEVLLGKIFIPSFAFISTAVCLAVGFQDPSVFLIFALFLVLLCF